MTEPSVEMAMEKRLLIGGDYNFFEMHPGADCAGIYMIDNIKKAEDEGFYVGSSSGIKQRIYNHLREMRLKQHDNEILERVYEKYGEDSLFFYLLQEVPFDCPRGTILDLEQQYLDHFQCFNTNGGYNICRKAMSAHVERGYSLFVKDPDGKIHEVKGSISEFARMNNLREKGLMRVFSKTSKSYMRWTLPDVETPPIKEQRPKGQVYTLHHLDDRIETFTSVTAFARANNLAPPNVYQLVDGKFEYLKGWFIPENIKAKSIYTLEHMDGRLESFSNIKEFSKKHGIEDAGMIIRGTSDTLGGWFRPGDPPRYWEFQDSEGKIHKTYHLGNFCERNNLDYGMLRCVIRGQVNYYLGWSQVGRPVLTKEELEKNLQRDKNRLSRKEKRNVKND